MLRFVLCLGTALLSSVHAALGDLRAGGAGYAIVMDGFLSMTVSMLLETPTPLSSFTIEYWAMTTDPHMAAFLMVGATEREARSMHPFAAGLD